MIPHQAKLVKANQKALLQRQRAIRYLLLLGTVVTLWSYAIVIGLIHGRYTELHGQHDQLLFALLGGLFLGSVWWQLSIWSKLNLPGRSSLSILKDTLIFCRNNVIRQRDLVLVYLISYVFMVAVSYFFYSYYLPSGASELFDRTALITLIALICSSIFLISYRRQIRSFNRTIAGLQTLEN